MKKPIILFSLTASVFVLLLFSTFYCIAAEERITLTTYYPAPYGVYRELRADQMSIGSDYRQAALNDGTLIVSGNVGIGTMSPKAKLDVSGNILVEGVKPILVKRFGNIGKNVESNTGISAGDYYCWDAKWIIEGQFIELSAIFTYTKDGTWWVNSDWLHHKNEQNWEILCFRKEVSDWQSANQPK